MSSATSHFKAHNMFTLLWIFTCQNLWKNYERQDFYRHTDVIPCSGFFLLFHFDLSFRCYLSISVYLICTVVRLEFSPQNGGRATEASPSGCYPKSTRVSSLGLLYFIYLKIQNSKMLISLFCLYLCLYCPKPHFSRAFPNFWRAVCIYTYTCG